MITTEIKSKIIAAIALDRKNFDSNAKQAVALEINSAILTRINNGETENVLSDGKWVSIARKLNVELTNNPIWVTAKTAVYNHVYMQLQACQKAALSAILCDQAGIGKTYTAKQYVRENKFAIYVDCSQVKSKQKLIKFIAKEFGLNHTGKYADVYDDLAYYLRSIINPIIILDEAGDLEYTAFLELKALWNVTEKACAWYMMGADGLQAKIEKHRGLKKVGYAEIFDRFGNKYQTIVPHGKEAKEDFIRLQVAQVAKANGATDIQTIYARTEGSLRRVYTEVQKLKMA
ncbi:AAA family ATPase [Pedobacter sp. MW01-1-1]|uniref:AAA family ATPase n=1 Tax=Pedobacter sp. MW01-1-1 TaxID=3383027 RepID=UPI003FF03206